MLRILIADDLEAVRQGLRDLVERHNGWEVCAETSTLGATKAAIGELRPDVVVLDLGLLGDAAATVAEIHANSPKSEILILTMSESEETFRLLIGAGVRGYVFKSDSAKEIEAAIEALGNHRPYLTSKISEMIRETFLTKTSRAATGRPYMSPRERQIVQLLAEGKSNKEVARMLSISVKTVETHRATIMRKLGINSVVELVHFAVRNRIVVP